MESDEHDSESEGKDIALQECRSIRNMRYIVDGERERESVVLQGKEHSQTQSSSTYDIGKIKPQKNQLDYKFTTQEKSQIRRTFFSWCSL